MFYGFFYKGVEMFKTLLGVLFVTCCSFFSLLSEPVDTQEIIMVSSIIQDALNNPANEEEKEPKFKRHRPDKLFLGFLDVTDVTDVTENVRSHGCPVPTPKENKDCEDCVVTPVTSPRIKK
jgi:hypothetical protein